MASRIPSNGNVINGKHEGGFVYIEEEYKEIRIYRSKLQEMSFTDSLYGERGRKQYSDYLERQFLGSITPDTIESISNLGSFEDNNASAVSDIGFMFGAGTAMVASQLLKSQDHLVKVVYKDKSSSVLNIDDRAYQTLIVIASNIKEQKPIATASNIKEQKPIATASNIKEQKPTAKEPQNKGTPITININANNVEPTLDRIEMFIEDGDWERAKAYCNAGLDYFPKEYRLYKLSLLVDHKAYDLTSLILKIGEDELESDNNFKRAVRFGDNAFIEDFESAKNKVEAKLEAEEIEKKREQEYKDKKVAYDRTCANLRWVRNYKDCKNIVSAFKSLDGFEESDEKIIECIEKANELAKKEVEKLRKENQGLDLEIIRIKQNIISLKDKTQTIKQELEQYLLEIGYDIDVKEKEIIQQLSEVDSKILGEKKALEDIKEKLNEVNKEYEKVKGSLFKRSIKQELLEEIAALESKLNEKTELINTIEENKNDLDKKHYELILVPRRTINNKRHNISDNEKIINIEATDINRIINQMDINKKQILEIEHKIENNMLFD